MNQIYRYYEQPSDYGIKHYKKDKLEFDYIDKKIRKNKSEINVVGAICLKKQIDDKNANVLIIESQGKEYVFEIKILRQKILGYIEIEPDIYVAIADDLNIGFWLVVFIIVFSVCGLGFNKIKFIEVQNKVDREELIVDDGENIMYEEPVYKASEQENIVIPGYANLVISAENPMISLMNPKGNTVYMKYIIIEDDEIIYETNAIEPNKMVRANFIELLSEGEHHLIFSIQTFDIDTTEVCNGAIQKVKVRVEK